MGERRPGDPSPTTAQARRHILVALEKKDAVGRLAAMLAEGGWETETVSDSASALIAARTNSPDLVLVKDSAVDTAELVGALRKLPGTRDVPIVVFAGAGDTAMDRKSAVESGADDYLTGPITPRELVATVAAHLRVGRLRRESEARFRALIEASAEIVWTADVDGSIHDDSPSWRAHTGQTYEEWSGTGWLNALHPEDRERSAELWRRAAREGTIYEAEYRLHHAPTGEYRWSRARGAPLFHPDGSIRGWVGMNTDIHEHKQAAQALADSRRFLRSSLDALASHIAVLDENGVILEVNKSWRRFAEANGFGGKNHGVGTSYLAALQEEGRHDCDSAAAARGIRAVLSGNLPEFHLEYPCHSPQEQLWFVMTVTRFEDTGPPRVVVAHANVTDRVLVAQALKAANRRKDEFLAMLSHELRTPLTPVLMAVAGMEADENLPRSVRDDLAMIRRNVEIETKLIDDLLDLNRVMTGKLALQRETLALNDVVRQVCGICQPKIREKRLRLHMTCDESAGCVEADAARLQQVLWNVLSNAAKFTPEEGEIFVSTGHGNDGAVFVRIRDTGLGISKEVLPRIFDAFEQGDPVLNRQFGGLGLGLAIARALVEMHEGSIRAESDGPGFGTTFTIEVPQCGKRSVTKTAPKRDSGEKPGEGLRLLVVEDHADTARALARLLQNAGHEVHVAGDAATALGLAEQHPFDLLISDLGLPDSTGYELMALLQRQAPIPGIAMSGFGTEEDIRKSRDAGFSEHLVKPVDFGRLKQTIQRVRAAGA
jgi:PAS domain S-box-containing protein